MAPGRHAAFVVALVALALGRTSTAAFLGQRSPQTDLERVTSIPFLVQFVGVEDDASPQPRSPSSPKGSLCLTTGAEDKMNGVALYWHVCQTRNVIATGQLSPAIHDAQIFYFTIDGKLRNLYGKCVRRGDCGSRVAYDLGDCEDFMVTSFTVSKAVANDLYALKSEGSLLSAAVNNACDAYDECGPFMVEDRCGSNGCQENFEAAPGWTRGRSQYVTARKNLEMPDPEALAADVAAQALQGTGLTGLGATDDDGVCGTWVTEGPRGASFFYLNRQAGRLSNIPAAPAPARGAKDTDDGC